MVKNFDHYMGKRAINKDRLAERTLDKASVVFFWELAFGNLFVVIDPASHAWELTCEEMDRLLA